MALDEAKLVLICESVLKCIFCQGTRANSRCLKPGLAKFSKGQTAGRGLRSNGE